MFSKLVNQLGYRSSHHFSELLGKEDITLETMLDDDNVANELRNKNERFQQLYKLRKIVSLTQEQMLKLLSFILEMPPPDSNAKRSFRYPFYACEMLSLEIPFITNHFFPENEGTVLLDRLFAFLGQIEPVDDVLAGYWGQVLDGLFAKKSRPLLKYIYERQEILSSLIKQIHSKSVAELLQRVVGIEAECQVPQEIVQQRRFMLIDDLVQYAIIKDLNQSNFEVLDNIAHIISEIVTDHRTIFEGVQLVSYLIDPSRLKFFFERCVSFDKHISLCSATILCSLSQVIFNDKDADPPNFEREGLICCFIEYFDMLLDFFKLECHEMQKETFGKQIKPFGQNRLSILKAMSYTLQLGNAEVYSKFSQPTTVKVLVSLLQRYPWNNIMHQVIAKIFKALFSQGEKFDTEIPIHDIIEGFLEATEQKKDGKYRKGYLGFVTEIGQSFEKYQNKKDDNFRFDKPDDWVQFEDQFYKEANSQTRQQLGNFGSRKNSVDLANFKIIDVQQLKVQEEEESRSSDDSSSSGEEQKEQQEEEKTEEKTADEEPEQQEEEDDDQPRSRRR